MSSCLVTRQKQQGHDLTVGKMAGQSEEDVKEVKEALELAQKLLSNCSNKLANEQDEEKMTDDRAIQNFR